MKIVTRAIIPAAGMGRRMKTAINKQYLTLGEKPILAHTLDVFEGCSLIAEIILVIKEEEFDLCQDQVLGPYGYRKIRLVKGGQTRQESVYRGLAACQEDTDLVMIHDGARPLLAESIIRASIDQTIRYQATAVGVPAKNTIKVVDEKGLVSHTPKRESLIEIQTPQTFLMSLIKEAHDQAREKGLEGTDDAFLVEALDHPVKIVIGDYSNIKITTPDDLIIAESMIRQLTNKLKGGG